MSDLRTAALEALRYAHEQVEIAASNADWAAFDRASDEFDDAFDALRAALAADPKPVAWRVEWEVEGWENAKWVQYHDEFDPVPESWDDDQPLRVIPLYTAAPTAQPLTDEQIDRIADSDECNPDKGGWGPKFDYRAFTRAIERALGIGGTHG